ncbi:EAL domain-containing protein [Zooshikella ganghwensis]|uniref:EAL domain-containing protein n=1 Tax=Zooshikella ganghwensis TaxID=202772 RepID=A0A4P9VWN8_9GAMM|nr:EAL domain-containing protein [Zooshikella ganghwensis]RDH46310.1 EAL domain-containing protein [Zooshikella ganghwensis]
MSSLEYKGIRLRSSFQPIINVRHQRVVGYEAFIRGTSRQHQCNTTSPTILFNLAARLDQLATLDQLCRLSHCESFSTQDATDNWLFFKQTAGLVKQDILHSYALEQLLKQSLLPPYQLIIELSKKTFGDEMLLVEAASIYKNMGLLVAIDDVEINSVSAYQIERIKPDIIKLNLHNQHETAGQHDASHLFTNLVSISSEVGSLCIVSAVETEKQAVLALSSGIDLLQGNLLSMPSPSLYAGSSGLHQQAQQLQHYLL